MRRTGLALTVAALAVTTLAACGSADSSAGDGAPASSGSAIGAGVSTGTTSASADASASASAGGSGGGNGSSASSGGGLGGYAVGVGSGPASKSCKLTAAQVGSALGEPVKATSEGSTGGVLACYYRTTSSTATSNLTVTVEKVPVAGLYKQSRQANAQASSDQDDSDRAQPGGVEQKCTIKDTTFDGHTAFTTTCTTSPDKQRVGGLQWDYSGGRFFHVSAVAIGRKDRTPAQLLTVSEKLAKTLVA